MGGRKKTSYNFQDIIKNNTKKYNIPKILPFPALTSLLVFAFQMNDLLVHAGYSSYAVHPLQTIWIESHQVKYPSCHFSTSFTRCCELTLSHDVTQSLKAVVDTAQASSIHIDRTFLTVHQSSKHLDKRNV